MDAKQMKDRIAAGAWDSIEGAWLDAISEEYSPSNLSELLMVLEALSGASKEQLAQTLAEMLVDETRDKLKPSDDLAMLKGVLLAVPGSDTIRILTAEMYKTVYGKHEHFDAIFSAAGLLSGQSPRRAIRTLDLCLVAEPGTYLVNRYEGQVMKLVRFDPIMEQFELVDSSGKSHLLDPKAFADLYEPLDERDFRVLGHCHPKDVAQRLKQDPAGVLVGICMSRGGSIDSNDLKEFLVPNFLDAKSWSSWWGRARTAAKRCSNLSLEGRNPIIVNYHPEGLTLEDELAPALEDARTPLDFHVLLGQYLRECRARKISPRDDFAGKILASLADQATRYLSRRPADAFLAALALQSASAAGLKTTVEHPSPSEAMLIAQEPEHIIAAVPEPPLWPRALDALEHRADAAQRLEALLYLAPTSQLDEVHSRLIALGQDEAVEQAVGKSTAEPVRYLDLFLWLWRGPAHRPACIPPKVELLGRLLKLVQELDHEWEGDNATRKDMYQKIRSAISAVDFAAFREALGQMDEAVGDTVKRQIERLYGLAESATERCLGLLRETFPALFFTRQQVEPWKDENVIWTTEEALHRQEAQFKELTEVKMLENARAIGEAAEHGDLSENSEWKFALEERDMLQSRAAKMQDELSRAKVIHPSDVPTDYVGVGSKVTVERPEDGSELVLTFLGPWEIDLSKNIYSYMTRLAQDIMGKKVGDSVELKFDGSQFNFVIKHIASAL